VLDTFALRCLVDGFFRGRHRLRKEPVMLLELRVGVQRYRALWEVLDGASVSEVARRFVVSRQSVHTWLRRYAADQGLGDRSSRPRGCPHQMSPVVQAKIVEIRRVHPG
jgi:transposase